MGRWRQRIPIRTQFGQQKHLNDHDRHRERTFSSKWAPASDSEASRNGHIDFQRLNTWDERFQQPYQHCVESERYARETLEDRQWRGEPTAVLYKAKFLLTTEYSDANARSTSQNVAIRASRLGHLLRSIALKRTQPISSRRSDPRIISDDAAVLRLDTHTSQKRHKPRDRTAKNLRLQV